MYNPFLILFLISFKTWRVGQVIYWNNMLNTHSMKNSFSEPERGLSEENHWVVSEPKAQFPATQLPPQNLFMRFAWIISDKTRLSFCKRNWTWSSKDEVKALSHGFQTRYAERIYHLSFMTSNLLHLSRQEPAAQLQVRRTYTCRRVHTHARTRTKKKWKKEEVLLVKAMANRSNWTMIPVCIKYHFKIVSPKSLLTGVL